MRQCSKCGERKKNSAFSKCSGGSYLRPECKICSNELQKVRKALKEKFGSPPEGYICPICGRKEKKVKNHGGKTPATWVIDHSHETDEFRGWLCHACNRGLGVFNDDVGVLIRSIEYLERKRMSNAEKQCRSCLDMKPFVEFSKNSRNKDGYRYFCKECEKDKAREYYDTNKSQIKDKVEGWQKTNAEKVRQYKRDYYHRNKTKNDA